MFALIRPAMQCIESATCMWWWAPTNA